MSNDISALTVRKLTVDLASGFDRHWHSGDAYRTMYYNALSMSFPVGEQSFIDSVRDTMDRLPEDARYDKLRADIAQFIGQEATHRHLHGQYNAQLAKQGLVNHWENWATTRIQWARRRKLSPMYMLAITAAYEHCTAVFGDGALRYDRWLAKAEPKMRLMWRWHAAEETEHKAVAFDLYRALGGSERQRVLTYLYVLFMFALESHAQTINNLWHDGTLFKPRTLWGFATMFFGRDGVVWRSTGPMLKYLAPSFHPNRHGDPTLAENWLAAHNASWRAVR